MKTTQIYPRNVRVGDRMLTTNGMREVLAVAREGKTTCITVEDACSQLGSTVLRCYERQAKVTIQRGSARGAAEVRS